MQHALLCLVIGISLLVTNCGETPSEPTPEAQPGSTFDTILIDTFVVDTTPALPPRVASDPYENWSLDSLTTHYKSIRNNIERQRKKLASKYAEARTDDARKLVRAEAYQLLLKSLSEEVWPVWYGTEWDYNGYTNNPRNGLVACGYFVSTTVKHCNFKLNRYDLAKKYSHAIVKSLCDEERIQMIRNSDTEALLAYIEDQPNDLYVIGLDNHVGFMLKNDEGIYFVHSSYYDPGYVAKEVADQSSILASSDLYVLGHMASNKELLEKWLKGNTVQVIE